MVGMPVTRHPPRSPGRAVFYRHRRDSSVVLASAQGIQHALIAIPLSEPVCPACVSFAGYVLPSSPSPCLHRRSNAKACDELSTPPITMLDTTPTQPGSLHVSFSSPSCLCSKLRVTHSPVSGFPLRASISSSLICAQQLNGPPKFLCASLHTCHGLITPPVLHIFTYSG